MLVVMGALMKIARLEIAAVTFFFDHKLLLSLYYWRFYVFRTHANIILVFVIMGHHHKSSTASSSSSLFDVELAAVAANQCSENKPQKRKHARQLRPHVRECACARKLPHPIDSQVL